MTRPIQNMHRVGRLVRALAAAMLLIAAGIAAADTLKGQVVGITDGDTFTLLTADKEQVKVRVAEIDAPERGQPYANRSRQQLADLIFRKEVSVDVQVVDRYGRPVGRPRVGDTDVTVEMIRNGAAWVYRTYSDDVELYEQERVAKDGRKGLWGLPEYERVPPWEYRNGEPQKTRVDGPAAAFQCGSKTYCREMVSCDEARFYLESCGLTRLDGDGDGVPCEAICR